ncbi:uncharacterized protein LOC105702591 isoform X2 [Orussus abietinus]|uniref:uncharacterized protein LOC105702591 isoform X2 n=1 Tax=Orussus abietinus TaxID=222816 RepID=UPI000C715AFF|nr:uncharacterized protein LOC105702591 isoform X2 [Orussus abietinus]XP_023288231.1 uncharacterized protein LOC105702591 isoform X2 [Orussus abietinus]
MENVNDVESASSQSAKLEPQEIEQEQPLEEQKSVENIEVLDDESAQPRYQIRPRLSEKFKPLTAKEVINNVLFDQLSTKTYDAEEAVQWSKNIADTIRERVKVSSLQVYCKHCSGRTARSWGKNGNEMYLGCRSRQLCI